MLLLRKTICLPVKLSMLRQLFYLKIHRYFLQIITHFTCGEPVAVSIIEIEHRSLHAGAGATTRK